MSANFALRPGHAVTSRQGAPGPNRPASQSLVIHHLSHSQVQSFQTCPRKWHYEKVEHAPRERTPASLVFGIAVHDALALQNEAALHGEAIDAPEAFVKAWSATVTEAGVPVHYGKDTADDLLTKGRALTAAYTPPPGIIGVEQAFTVELASDLPPVEGRIDLIRQREDAGLVLGDLKTSASRLLSDTYAAEAQLGLYDIAYPSAAHEVIVLGKLKAPTVTSQPITPLPAASVVRQYREVHHAMVSGVRFACRGWQCDGCPFGDRCSRDG